MWRVIVIVEVEDEYVGDNAVILVVHISGRG